MIKLTSAIAGLLLSTGQVDYQIDDGSSTMKPIDTVVYIDGKVASGIIYNPQSNTDIFYWPYDQSLRLNCGVMGYVDTFEYTVGDDYNMASYTLTDEIFRGSFLEPPRCSGEQNSDPRESISNLPRIKFEKNMLDNSAIN